jgi:TRAP-type C4-dicarboxylate transport system permease small subunit
VTGERRTAVSAGLVAAGLLLLAVGGFIQFDDFSGDGSADWNLPLGVMGVVAAVAAVPVAVNEPKARLWLGVTLGVLLALIFWQQLTNSGFRFIWFHDEGELGFLEIGLGLVAAVLVATGLQPGSSAAPRGGRWLVRAAVYLCGTVGLVVAAFIAGTAYYSATDCNDETDCLALLGGMLWSVIALPVAAVAIIVIEVVLRRRRNRQPEVR